MTASFDPVPDPEDRPATVTPTAPGTVLVPYRPRPSRWASLFRWWLGLSVVTFFAVALCAFIGFGHADFAPLHLVIDGEDLTDGITITGLDGGGRALLALGAGLVALFLLLMIPVLLMLLVGSVAIALVCGIAVPLVMLALALVVATSPFWMVGLLVWLILRRRDSQRYAGSATMAA